MSLLLTFILIKRAWYARMIRGSVIGLANRNYILYSKTVGSSNGFILRKHIIFGTLAEIIILATLDTGWVIINITTQSFLGL